ncbi:MAG: c-type cytochrome [Rubrivivax sp.]
MHPARRASRALWLVAASLAWAGSTHAQTTPAPAPAPVPAAAAAAAANPHLARNLAATCANCHGTNGQARGEMKGLAGEPAEKIILMMSAYKAGTLPGTTIMHQIAKGYTDEQIRLIAGHFAAQSIKK